MRTPRRPRAGAADPSPLPAWCEYAAVLTVIAVFAFVLVQARQLGSEAQIFPVTTSVIGVVLGLVVILQLALARRRRSADETDIAGGRVHTDLREQLKRLADAPSTEHVEAVGTPRMFWVWFLAFGFAIWGFGFYVGVPIAGALFVLVETRRWLSALFVGLGLWIYLYWIFRVLLGIRWFTGVFL